VNIVLSLDILDCLCIDDEMLETIVAMVNDPLNEKTEADFELKLYSIDIVKSEILEMIDKKYITARDWKGNCILEIDVLQFTEYWFHITEKGRDFYDANDDLYLPNASQ
jgi:hypothetical protein